MSYAEFFGKISNHPGDSVPLQPRFGALWLLAFPKTKITFEREEISDHWWDSGKYDRAADGNWENCVRSQGAYFEGDWGVLSYVQCSLYLVSSSINALFFILHGWIPSVQTIFICSNKTNNKKSLFFKVIPELITISSRFQLCPQGRQSSYLGLEQKDDNALRYVQKHQTESPDFYQPQE